MSKAFGSTTRGKWQSINLNDKIHKIRIKKSGNELSFIEVLNDKGGMAKIDGVDDENAEWQEFEL